MTNPNDKTILIDGQPMPVGGLEESPDFDMRSGYLFFCNRNYDLLDSAEKRHAACVASMFYRHLADRVREKQSGQIDNNLYEEMVVNQSAASEEWVELISAAEAWGEIIRWEGE